MMKVRKPEPRVILNDIEAKELVMKAAPKVWQAIHADAGEISMDEAVELVMDAGRPVTFGGMTQEQYDFICAMPYQKVDKWCEEALKGLV